MPAAKLTPPTHSMRTRKLVEPSERCGVITAAKIFGSEGAPWSAALLSPFMAAIIRKNMAKKTTAKAARKSAPRSRKTAPKGRAAAKKRRAAAQAHLKGPKARVRADREA